MTSKKSKKRSMPRADNSNSNSNSSGQPPPKKKQTIGDTTLATVLSGRDIERAIILSANFQREREFVYGIMDEIFRATPQEDGKTSEEDEDIDVEPCTNNYNNSGKFAKAKEVKRRLWEAFYETDNLYKRCANDRVQLLNSIFLSLFIGETECRCYWRGIARY